MIRPDKVLQNFADGIGVRRAQLSMEWVDQFAAEQAAVSSSRNVDRADTELLSAGRLGHGSAVYPRQYKGAGHLRSIGKMLTVSASNLSWHVGSPANLPPSTKRALLSPVLASFGVAVTVAKTFT